MIAYTILVSRCVYVCFVCFVTEKHFAATYMYLIDRAVVEHSVACHRWVRTCAYACGKLVVAPLRSVVFAGISDLFHNLRPHTCSF